MFLLFHVREVARQTNNNGSIVKYRTGMPVAGSLNAVPDTTVNSHERSSIERYARGWQGLSPVDAADVLVRTQGPLVAPGAAL